MRFLIMMVTWVSLAAQAQELKLEEYLLQVRGSHPGLKAAKEGMEGAQMRANEGNLQFMPQFELSALHEVDEKPYHNTAFNGVKSTSDLYTAAIAQQTPIGLTAKFGYTFLRRNVEGSDPNFQPDLSYTGAPMLEISLPLWRNVLGSEVRANRDKVKAATQAEFYGQRLKFDSVALQAETAYSGLYFARQTTTARRESLDVAKKLLDWMKQRASKELADDNDYNQAKAAYEARELELIKAEYDERAAARAFNSLRGINSDVVQEKLAYTPPTPDLSRKSTKLMKDEVRIAEKQKLIAEADAQLGIERTRPTVEIFGSYSRNSLNRDRADAMSDSWKDDHPYQAVGVRMQMPLIFWENKKVNDGYRRSKLAADLQLQRTFQENERDLANLYQQIETSQKLVSLSQRLVETQKQKLEKERRRHRLGRTTLYQVLQYEHDYVQSQLAQIGNQAELVALVNQLRLYRGE